jgi:hypothetical protein
VTTLASPLLLVSWPWSAGELVVTLAAAAAAVARHGTLAARSDGDDAERELALLRRGERRAAFLAGGKTLGVVAGALLVVLLTLAATPVERARAWAFAAGVAVAAAAAAVVGEIEASARARISVAARSSPASAADVAWEGGLVATLVATAAQTGATLFVSAVTEGATAPLGLAAGMALVACFVRSVRSVAPATARAIALMSVQSLALAAAAGAVARFSGGPLRSVRPDLVHVARLLVALGAVAPLALRGASGIAEGRPLARRLFLPGAALLGGGFVIALFVGPAPAFEGGPAAGWSALAVAILCGVLLVSAVARVAEHAADGSRDRSGGADTAELLLTLPASRFVACLVLAAALVVAASAAGAFGIALAAAAAAAALPGFVAAGFGADLEAGPPAPPAGPPARLSDAERAAGSAALALAGWALLSASRRAEVRQDLLSADAAGGAVAGVALVLFAAAWWRRAESAGGSNSTRAGLRAMIGPALLAVAAPFGAARLNLAAAGGMATGALLGGATAALLIPRATAALFDRVVSLICITYVLCAR